MSELPKLEDCSKNLALLMLKIAPSVCKAVEK